MHEYFAVDKCSVPILAKCLPRMGKVQHPC
jgi:hypothetical protein